MYSASIGELYSRRGVVPAKKYRIELTAEEQQELKALVSKGRAAAYKQTHARIPRFHEGRLCCLAMKRGKTEA